MRRVLVVAQAELLALVRTKFFIIGIVSMPLIGASVFAFLAYAENHVDLEDRTFAVIDHTGVLYDAIASEAARQNREAGEGALRRAPHFLPTRVDPDGHESQALKVELSERVRNHEFFAFVEIPAEVLGVESTDSVGYY